MIKYTRSLQQLSAKLEYIFRSSICSIDTKAIVLILSATMPREEFHDFIDSIDSLGPISYELKDINDLGLKFGAQFRDYIIVHTLQRLDRDVNSDELQQFISTHKSTIIVPSLNPALRIEDLQPEFSNDEAVDQDKLIPLMRKAANYLIENLESYDRDKSSTIVDTYLHCRDKAHPVIAYRALIFAMASILEASGLDTKQSLFFSHKLAKHSLEQFTKEDNTILHAYKTTANINS